MQNIFKYLLLIILIMLLTETWVASIANVQPVSNEKSANSEDSSKTAKQPTDRLIVFVNRDFEPYSFINSNGDLDGIFIESLQKLEEAAGIDIEPRSVRSKDLSAQLKDNENSALLWPGASQIKNFKHQLTGTNNLYGKILFTAFHKIGEEKISSIEQLGNAKYALVGSPLPELIGLYPENRVSVDSSQQAIELLLAGKIKYLLGPHLNVSYQLNELGLLNLTESAFSISSAKQDINLELNSNAKYFLPQLNAAIQQINRGTLPTLMAKWQLSRRQGLLLNSDERNYIDSSPPITLCMVGLAGNYTSSELIVEFILKETGLKINHSTPLSWEEGLNALKTGECDLLPWATETDKRKKTMLFTPVYASFSRVLATRKEQAYIPDIAKHLDKTYVIEGGDNILGQLKSNYPDIKILEVAHVFEAMQLVESDRAFAYIGSKYDVANFIESYDKNDIKITGYLPSKFDDKHSIAVRKEAHKLNRILIKAVNYADRNAIEQNLLSVKNVGSGRFKFTEQQTRFLASRSVTICNLELLDGKDNTQELINLITNGTGLSIQYSGPMSWNEGLQGLKSGVCDVLPSATETSERKKLLNFTPAYVSIPQVILTRNDQPYITDISDHVDKTFAMLKGKIFAPPLKDVYPDIKIRESDDFTKVLDLLNQGKVFGSIQLLNTASRALTKYSNAQLKVSGYLPAKFDDNLAVATRKEDQILHQILSKAVELADPAEIRGLVITKPPNSQPISKLNKEELDLLLSATVTICQLDTLAGERNSSEVIGFITKDIENDFEVSRPMLWSDALEGLMNGTCDLLPYATETGERARHMEFTTPFATVPRVVATLRGQPFIPDIARHLDKTFSVVKDDSLIKQLKDAYPNIKLKLVDSTNRSLDLVRENQVFGAIHPLDKVNNFVLNYSAVDIKVNGHLPSQFNDQLAIAFRKKDQSLYKLFSKIVESTNQLEVTNFLLQQKNSSDRKIKFSTEEISYMAANTVEFCNTDGLVRNTNDEIFLKEVSTNIPLKLISSKRMNWAEAVQNLGKGDCDVLLGATETQERKKSMLFTPNYVRIPTVILTLDTVAYFPNIEEHLDKRFAVIEGNTIIDLLKKTYPDIEIEEVRHAADGINLVQKQQAFGFIQPLDTLSTSITNLSLENLKITSQLSAEYDDQQAFAVPKQNELLHSILTKIVNTTDKLSLRQWLLKYSGSNLKQIQFTKQEFNLVNNNRFTVCDIFGLTGPNKELMSYILNNNGIRVSFSSAYSWNDARQALKNKKCDILPWLTPSPERAKSMLFTTPYFEEESVIVTSDQQLFISDISNHLDKTFGLHKGDILNGKLLAEYPNIKLIEADRTIQVLNMVYQEKAFAAIVDISQAAENIRLYELKGLKIAGGLPSRFNNISTLGTRKSDKLLNGVLRKAVDASDKKEIQKIMLSRRAIKYNKGIDYTLFWQIAITSLILLILFVFWNRRLAELNRQTELAKATAIIAKQKVKGLLNSSGEGFLSFGSDLKIESEYSLQCLELFQMDDIAGKKIGEILFPHGGKDHETLLKGLQFIFLTDKEDKKKILIELLPKTIRINQRSLELKFKSKDAKMILIAVDITRQEQLHTKLEEEQLNQKKIINALTHRNEIIQIALDFEAFFRKAKHDFSGKNSSLDVERLNTFYRKVHTFKGLFLQFCFNESAACLHNLEDDIDAFLSVFDSQTTIPCIVLLGLLESSNVHNAFDRDKSIICERLGTNFLSSRRQFVIGDKLLTELIINLGNKDKLFELLSNLKKIDLFKSLKTHATAAKNQSLKINKTIESIRIEGDNINLDESIYKGFITSLIHLFRNAVAHGIESPEIREHLNKPSGGKIDCFVEKLSDKFLLIFSDDGYGIDVEKLRQRIKGDKEAYSMLTDDQVLLTLFQTRLSGAKEITIDSGRGVGLSEVYYQLKKLGGEVEIETTLGKGTTFTFTIPLKNNA